MIRLRLNRDTFTADELAPAVEAIRHGGVVAFPTDTLYGLAVDPRSEAAVRRLVELKRRSLAKAIPLIAESTRQVIDQVGTMTPLAESLAWLYWPGPLTLIISASAGLCEEVHGGTHKVAVRVPDHPVARALARAAGHAITSTSANRSGEEAASDAEDVLSALGDRLDVLVDAGPAPGGPPSTIVDATGTAPELVRAGAIPWERVIKFLH